MMETIGLLEQFCKLYGYELEENGYCVEERYYKYPCIFVTDAVQFGRDFENYTLQNWLDGDIKVLNDYDVEYFGRRRALVNWKNVSY